MINLHLREREGGGLHNGPNSLWSTTMIVYDPNREFPYAGLFQMGTDNSR